MVMYQEEEMQGCITTNKLSIYKSTLSKEQPGLSLKRLIYGLCMFFHAITFVGSPGSCL